MKGSKKILFKSKDMKNQDKFYINSTPTHKIYKIVVIVLEGQSSEDIIIVKDCNKVELGVLESSNNRIINKFVLLGQVESCQLVMGYTNLKTRIFVMRIEEVIISLLWLVHFTGGTALYSSTIRIVILANT